MLRRRAFLAAAESAPTNTHSAQSAFGAVLGQRVMLQQRWKRCRSRRHRQSSCTSAAEGLAGNPVHPNGIYDTNKVRCDSFSTPTTTTGPDQPGAG